MDLVERLASVILSLHNRLARHSLAGLMWLHTTFLVGNHLLGLFDVESWSLTFGFLDKT